ncbi:MAG: hypothetical protein QF416_02590 [Candidatus Marinimicrobia bacterium]|jgi:hypothetical protein|nr:hypothetical protein [Candidatus Neomarinimicrobiota bacterium]
MDKIKVGDLVQARKGGRLGIVSEIFADLDPSNPWVRIRWTHPKETFEWCKMSGLMPAAQTDKGDP